MTTIGNNLRRASLLFASSVIALQMTAQQRALTGTVYEADGKYKVT